MKRNIFNKIVGIALASVMLASCDPGDFEDMNVDPNKSSSARPSTLLTGAIRSIPDAVNNSTLQLYSQHLSQKQYTEESRYSIVNHSFNFFYTDPLANLQEIIKMNTDAATKSSAEIDGSNNNQIAVAKILKSYYFLQIADRWGSAPYSDALKGNANFKPKYDSQQEIYNALFTELKDASTLIDQGGVAVKGDQMLGGNMAKWKKFGNSLRLIMALRLSNVDATKASAEFAAALAGGVITTNADNVMYTHLAEQTNDNPWEDAFETRLDWTVSDRLVNYMKPLADPRLAVYADPAKSKNDFVGMPYGLSQAVAGGIKNDDVSFLGAKMRAQNSPTYVVTAAQVLFTLAEGAKRGYVAGGDAQAAIYYNDAIKASWEQYGVYDAAAYATFIAQAGVAYNPATGIEQIINQKWVAQFMNGLEAWSDWRRTGFPAFVVAPADNLNPTGAIPVRQGYPTTERDLNKANYDAAVTGQGADDLNTRVWWDK